MLETKSNKLNVNKLVRKRVFPHEKQITNTNYEKEERKNISQFFSYTIITWISSNIIHLIKRLSRLSQKTLFSLFYRHISLQTVFTTFLFFDPYTTKVLGMYSITFFYSVYMIYHRQFQSVWTTRPLNCHKTCPLKSIEKENYMRKILNFEYSVDCMWKILYLSHPLLLILRRHNF